MKKLILFILLTILSTAIFSANLWNCPPYASCVTDQFDSCSPSANKSWFDPDFVGYHGPLYPNVQYTLTTSIFEHHVNWAICDYVLGQSHLIYYTWPSSFEQVIGKNWSPVNYERTCTDFINCKYVLPLEK